MLAISLTIACSRSIHNSVILHVHPVRGESHNQRNATGKAATAPFHSVNRSNEQNDLIGIATDHYFDKTFVPEGRFNLNDYELCILLSGYMEPL